MCGIFFCLKKSETDNERFYNNLDVFENAFNLLNNRGPDHSLFKLVDNKIFGFKRLSINDLSVEGNQPFLNPSLSIEQSFSEFKQLSMCNGEIYNHKELETKYKLKMKSHSDCECLIPLYNLFMSKNEKCVTENLIKFYNEIDGVFGMFIYDRDSNKIIIARDRIGVKPLFVLNNDEFFIVSSEAKSIDYIKKNYLKCDSEIMQFPPRTFGVFDTVSNELKLTSYFNMNNFLIPTSEYTIKDKNKVDIFSEKLLIHISNVHNLLYKAVQKRLLSDRPIGCLLSGGVDSSIIASILSKLYKTQGKKIKTFSIGFPDSTDLKYAKIVAEFIGSEHHEYVIQYEDALKAIPEVIKAIETYDITTIRASTPMYLLCKWIKENFEETVIFSGEGSDEVFGGYLYFHNAPDIFEFQRETIKLVSNLHVYDVLRADRCTSGNSLELREPFLDKELIDYVCNLSSIYKQPLNTYEKYLLRKAFNGYLPKCVLWRKKAAFSDAVSGSEKPWYKYIQEYCEDLITNDELDVANKANKANKANETSVKFTKESYWFYKTFRELFPCYDLKIQYWLPKWCNTTDPSATTISNVYNKNEHQ
jgi:asparagine synthase (glutamine-hydrolysing)